MPATWDALITFITQPKFDPLSELSDLTGKVVIVTGGNGGIGYYTVQFLARKGAKVYMAARNEEKASLAIGKLKKEGLEPGNGEVLFMKLDLSDPKGTRSAAEKFVQQEKRLDVLGTVI